MNSPFFVLLLPVLAWEMFSLAFQLRFIIFFLLATLLVLPSERVAWKGLGNNLVMDCCAGMKPHFFFSKDSLGILLPQPFFSPRRLHKSVLVAIHCVSLSGQPDSYQFPWLEPWFPENTPSAQHFLEPLELIPNAEPEVPMFQ